MRPTSAQAHELIAASATRARRCALNYAASHLRPRRPEELDTQGSGADVQPGAHQVVSCGCSPVIVCAHGSRRDRHVGSGPAHGRRVLGAIDVRRRRLRVAHLQRLRAFRQRRILWLDRRDRAAQGPGALWLARALTGRALSARTGGAQVRSGLWFGDDCVGRACGPVTSGWSSCRANARICGRCRTASPCMPLWSAEAVAPPPGGVYELWSRPVCPAVSGHGAGPPRVCLRLLASARDGEYLQAGVELVMARSCTVFAIGGPVG